MACRRRRVERDRNDRWQHDRELERRVHGINALASEEVAGPRIDGVERGVEVLEESHGLREVVALARDCDGDDRNLGLDGRVQLQKRVSEGQRLRRA